MKNIKFIVVIFSTIFSSLLISFLQVQNLKEIEETETFDDLLAPNDFFIFQRTYPENIFDLKTFKEVLNFTNNETKKSNVITPGAWILQGPQNIGGRINCLAIHPTNANIMLAGNAGGGIFKTIDGGTNWIPVFDNNAFLAIGCITYDNSNPNIIYAGTGDVNIPGAAYIGDGIFKSIDGGNTWTNIGLSQNGIISKIIVAPNNSNIIYAATMGIPYFRDNNRGLYKSTDGGVTWTQNLFVGNDAGIIDLVISNSNPQVLYASAWNRIRNNSESLIYGNAAKVYKTNNGGASWTTLGGGLPLDPASRIGLAIDPNNSNTLYANYVDSTLELGGVYKTTDAGLNWNSLNISDLVGMYNGFGWYFNHIYINPQNSNQLWIGGVDLYKSEDAGNTWQLGAPDWWTYEVHADKHDLRFSSNGIFLCTDGGLYKTLDNGVSWTDADNIPNTQFYRTAYNMHDATNYYGGAQDNGTTRGNNGSINNWDRLYGGDGFQPNFDENNSQVYYAETQNGNLVQSTSGPFNFGGFNSGIDFIDRRNWDMPYIVSKHISTTLFCGTDKVYRVDNATSGGVWTPISPDLCDTGWTNSPRFHNISTVEQSPINANYLYAGTTDDNVWYSPDAGLTWQYVSSNLPNRYVTHLQASPLAANTIFVSFSGYKDGDNTPHIFKSINNGATWQGIAGDLPNLGINNILLFPTDENIIFIATDGGVFVTQNGGINWQRIGNNMPVYPVLDIDFNIAQNQLVAATYARSMISYDLNNLQLELITNTATISIDKVSISIQNPTYNKLNLGINNPEFIGATLKLFDLNGNLKLEKRLSNNLTQSIDFSELNHGIYLLNICKGGRQFNTKILKIAE
jgi:photosystem II stability/assembly factor-like uncharacterized protein